MSEPKFTPGPWVILDREELEQDVPKLEGSQGFGISTEDHEKSPAKIRTVGLTDEEIRGNAYLIAAAPELYEALKRLRDTAGEFTEDSLAAALDQANDALLKADGGL